MATLWLTLDSVFLFTNDSGCLFLSILPSCSLSFLPRRYYRDREEASHEIFESALASFPISLYVCASLWKACCSLHQRVAFLFYRHCCIYVSYLDTVEASIEWYRLYLISPNKLNKVLWKGPMLNIIWNKLLQFINCHNINIVLNSKCNSGKIDGNMCMLLRKSQNTEGDVLSNNDCTFYRHSLLSLPESRFK